MDSIISVQNKIIENRKPLCRMKLKTYTLPILMAIASCKPSNNHDLQISWNDNLTLPSLPKDSVNPGLAGAFSAVLNNHLIIAGGANFPDGLPWEGGKKFYHDEVYVFNNENGNWKFNNISHLQDTLGYGAAVIIDSGMVCLGGENENGISSNALLLKYDSVKRKITTSNLASLPIPLTNLSAVSFENKIFIAGGATSDSVSDRMFELDCNNSTPEWKELAPLPKPLTNFLMVKLGDQIFAIGGRCIKPDGISELYNSVFAYNISENKWTEKKSLPCALSAGTGIALNNHQILLFGGDKGETFHKTELLIQQIKNEKDSLKKASLIKEKNRLQETHPGFSKSILLYDDVRNEWSRAGNIPFTTPVTTTALKNNNQVIIPSGEIRAGIRTPRILIGIIKSD